LEQYRQYEGKRTALEFFIVPVPPIALKTPRKIDPRRKNAGCEHSLSASMCGTANPVFKMINDGYYAEREFGYILQKMTALFEELKQKRAAMPYGITAHRIALINRHYYTYDFTQTFLL